MPITALVMLLGLGALALLLSWFFCLLEEKSLVLCTIFTCVWMIMLAWCIIGSCSLTSKLVSTEPVPIQSIKIKDGQYKQYVILEGKLFDLTEKTGCSFGKDITHLLVRRWAHKSIGIDFGMNDIGISPAMSKAEIEFEVVAPNLLPNLLPAETITPK